ncbi:HET domain-containing protein [Fusarium sp. LHS14.1]|nr:HET domain-containing protein [Fusarium sp. LHS14.1]
MDTNAESIPQVPQCPICLLIRVRDTSQQYIPKRPNETLPSDAGPATESKLASCSKPFELERERHPTLSYEAALDFFHGEPCGDIDRATSVCNLCDHWVNGIFTREWGDREPIARVSLGTLAAIESRSGCIVCHFLCQTVSQSPFTLDNTRPLALELGRTPHVRSCKYRAAGMILYEDVEEFQHHTQTEKKYPQLTVFNKNDIIPDFTNAEVNWERLRHWYAELPSATGKTSSVPRDKSSSINDALPKGFCLTNVSEACLIETDGVQVPNYAALSYVWGKSDEEIITTTNNFESLKLPGRFREKDVPLLFRDAFEVCS